MTEASAYFDCVARFAEAARILQERMATVLAMDEELKKEGKFPAIDFSPRLRRLLTGLDKGCVLLENLLAVPEGRDLIAKGLVRVCFDYDDDDTQDLKVGIEEFKEEVEK